MKQKLQKNLHGYNVYVRKTTFLEDSHLNALELCL